MHVQQGKHLQRQISRVSAAVNVAANEKSRDTYHGIVCTVPSSFCIHRCQSCNCAECNQQGHIQVIDKESPDRLFIYILHRSFFDYNKSCMLYVCVCVKHEKFTTTSM